MGDDKRQLHTKRAYAQTVVAWSLSLLGWASLLFMAFGPAGPRPSAWHTLRVAAGLAGIVLACVGMFWLHFRAVERLKTKHAHLSSGSKIPLTQLLSILTPFAPVLVFIIVVAVARFS